MAFADADDLAALQQRTFTAGETAAATLLLDLATAAIQNYTRQTISLVEDDTVLLRTSQGGTLILPERPVVDVTLVRLGETTVAAASYLLVGEELRWGATALNIGNLAESDGGWGSSALLEVTYSSALLEVTYSHGFQVIPDDIKGICLALAARGLNNPTQMGSESIGNYSYTLATGSDGSVFNFSEKEQLNRYRRRAWSMSVA